MKDLLKRILYLAILFAVCLPFVLISPLFDKRKLTAKQIMAEWWQHWIREWRTLQND